MKKYFQLFLIFLCSVYLFACSEEGRIVAAYENGKELEEGDLVPFLLEQNHPNPFNPQTAITFLVAVQHKIKLSVYTEDWQLVKILFNRELPPGTHMCIFDAEKLASGEYFYMMEGAGVRQIRKMKLVK